MTYPHNRGHSLCEDSGPISGSLQPWNQGWRNPIDPPVLAVDSQVNCGVRIWLYSRLQRSIKIFASNDFRAYSFLPQGSGKRLRAISTRDFVVLVFISNAFFISGVVKQASGKPPLSAHQSLSPVRE